MFPLRIKVKVEKRFALALASPSVTSETPKVSRFSLRERRERSDTFGDGRDCLLLCASKVLLGNGKPGFQRPKVVLVIFGLFFSRYSKERPKVTPKVSREARSEREAGALHQR
jgi:hypothetical protein